MSHIANEKIIDAIRELRDLVQFLESELLDYSLHGNYDGADQAYGELVDARTELEKLEKMIGL